MDVVRVLRLLPRQEEAWMQEAVCKGALEDGADPFFPERGMTTTDAKRICAACPVVEECLEYALEIDPQDDFGIWGGTSAQERKLIRKEARLPRDRRYVFKEAPVFLPTLAASQRH